jgi:hypothetical protein
MNQETNPEPQSFVIDPVTMIKKSYSWFKQDLGQFLAMALLVVGSSIFLNFMDSIQSLGIIVLILRIVLLPLSAGIYSVFQSIDRGESYTFAKFFDGYKLANKIIVATAIQVLIVVIPAIIIMLAMFGQFLDEILKHPEQLETYIQQGTFDISKLSLGYLLLIGHLIYFSLAYCLATPYIILYRFSAWKALETSRKVVSKKFLPFLGLGFVLLLFNLMGLFLLCIGVLFTGIITMGVLYWVARKSMEDISELSD